MTVAHDRACSDTRRRDARGAGRSRGEGTVGCCAYACESSLSVRSRWAGGAVARTGQSSSRRRVRPWPVWGQRRGIAAGEPRGCGRPPWVGSARYVKLLAAKLAQYMRAALRAPRCREPWPGSEPLKTVDAQFSVLRRTCSVSELCIISLHANK
jgi:hypothetical protein